MKLIVIFGAGAVGKMTVGQELAKATGLRLFHNHLDLELLVEVFGGFGNIPKGLGTRIRRIVFEEFARSNQYGLIFTFVWALDHQSEWDYLDSTVDIFRKENAEIYYVELVATQEVRLIRNATENRQQHKATKRDVEASKARLIHEDANYRLVSNDGEIPFENYIKIDNSNLAPDVVAHMIKDRFSL